MDVSGLKFFELFEKAGFLRFRIVRRQTIYFNITNLKILVESNLRFKHFILFKHGKIFE